jgi:hypothetical protein
MEKFEMKRFLKLLTVAAVVILAYTPQVDAYQHCQGEDYCCINFTYCCDDNGNPSCKTGCEDVGAPVCDPDYGGGTGGGGGGTELEWDCTYIPFWGFVCTYYKP